MHSPSTPQPKAAAAPRKRHPFLTSARAAALLMTASGVLIALVVTEWGPLLSFDRTSASGLHEWALAEPAVTRTNRIMSDWVWDPWTMRALTGAAVVLVWFRGERVLACWVAAASVLGSALQQGLKAAVGRDRPHWPDPVDSAHYAAFPSGHAMTAAVTCGLLLWLLHRNGTGRRLWAAAVVVATVSVLGVGLTRLWLGVHWSSDVLGGWLLGGALVALCVTTYGRLALSGER